MNKIKEHLKYTSNDDLLNIIYKLSKELVDRGVTSLEIGTKGTIKIKEKEL